MAPEMAENSLSRLTQLEAILSGGESEKDVLENGPPRNPVRA
jgi:hypothetical protein